MTDETKPAVAETAADAALAENAAANTAAGGNTHVTAVGNVADATAVAPSSATPADELARLTDEIVTALKTVYDPEIPADIYELGLIYNVDVDDDRGVKIKMTLTTPNCPAAADLPGEVENAVASVPGVREAKVDIVWDPPWDPSRMSDEARAVLNMW